MGQTKKGLTIIELIIYVAIVATIFVTVVNILLISSRAFAVARTKRNVNEEGILAMERLIREARLAESVVGAESTFGIHPGSLKMVTLVNPSGTETTTRRFFVQGTQLMMQEGTSAATAFTSGRVRVSNLVFQSIRPRTVYYVRKSFAGCSDAATGTTPSTAFCTIGKAASVAGAGSVIYVGAGTYTESVRPSQNGESGAPIIFIGDKDGKETGDAGSVIVQSGDEPGFNLKERSYITVMSFDIKQSKDGVRIENSAAASSLGIIVENSTFTGIISGTGGVNVQSPSTLTVNSNHIVRGNTFYTGGGTYGVYMNLVSNFLIENNIFYSNGDGNIGVMSGQGTIRNNLMYKTVGNDIIEIKGTVDTPTSLDIVHNTIYQGRDGIGIVGGSGQTLSVNIRDNIIMNNNWGGIAVSGEGVTCTYSSNIFFDDTVTGCTDLGGNRVNLDPLLVDPDGPDNTLGGSGGADDDFHLSQIASGQALNSPAVDSGSLNSATAGLSNRTTRTDGVADNGVVDLGFHYPISAFVNPSFKTSSQPYRAVRVEMTVEAGNGPTFTSQKLYGTAVLRRSY